MAASLPKFLLLRRLSRAPKFISSSIRRSSPSSSSPSFAAPYLLEASKAARRALPSTPSRSLCSHPSNLLDESKGPATIDHRSLLQEDEYHKLADSTIHDLLEKLEEYGDSIEVDGFDIDYGNQVLTLQIGNLGTYVLNKQTPNRQIWMSSPLSGPSRFDWDQNAQAWIYRRTKANLRNVLENELEKLCGVPVSLT